MPRHRNGWSATSALLATGFAAAVVVVGPLRAPEAAAPRAVAQVHGLAGASLVSTTADAKDLRAAVHAYSAAFLTGRERAAWRLLTPRCRSDIGRAAFYAVVNTAGNLYGYLPIRTYTATISGETARVTYTYAVRRLNQTRESWRNVNGNWRNNDC